MVLQHSPWAVNLWQHYQAGGCGLGGFNISNLMGIKRRMIDIGKNWLFTFAKCLKMNSFFAFAFKFSKCAIMTQKNLFLKISIWVTKKRRILCWFQIRWCRLKQTPLKRLEPKTMQIWLFSFLCIFSWFLLLTFVRGINGINTFEISIKFCVFFIPILIFVKKKFFLGHNSPFCKLLIQMRKNVHFFKHLAKSKKLFFCHYFSFSVWFLLKFQKKYKI